MTKKQWITFTLFAILVSICFGMVQMPQKTAAASKPGRPTVSLKKRTATTATIQMKKQNGITSYRIYMKSSAKGSYKLVGFTWPGSRTYKITKLKKTGTYWVKVRAYKKLRKSNYSKVIKINPYQKASANTNDSNPTEEEVVDYRQQVLDLVNAEREKEGLPALILDEDLCKAADIRSAELVELFEHTRPDGRDCYSVLDDQGISYSIAGENIAAGHASPEEVVEGWMNSEGHRANILNAEFTKMGISLCKVDSGYYYYWAQLFTK